MTKLLTQTFCTLSQLATWGHRQPAHLPHSTILLSPQWDKTWLVGQYFLEMNWRERHIRSGNKSAFNARPKSHFDMYMTGLCENFCFGWDLKGIYNIITESNCCFERQSVLVLSSSFILWSVAMMLKIYFFSFNILVNLLSYIAMPK